MLKLWKWYQNSLAVHPVKTQVISSGFIWGFGDIAAQTITYSTAKRHQQNQVNTHQENPIILSLFCIIFQKENIFCSFFTVLANGFLPFSFYFILLPLVLCLYVCMCACSLFGQLGICHFLVMCLISFVMGFLILIWYLLWASCWFFPLKM